MKDNWFNGPWCISDHTSLESRPNLDDGEILRHSSGNLLLNCPACKSLQFVTLKVEGDAESPTIRGDILCGSGGCTRCSSVFTIRAGKTVEVDRPKEKREIDWSHIRGAKKPPRIDR